VRADTVADRLAAQAWSRSISPTAGMLLFLGPALGPSIGGGALIAVGGWF